MTIIRTDTRELAMSDFNTPTLTTAAIERGLISAAVSAAMNQRAAIDEEARVHATARAAMAAATAAREAAYMAALAANVACANADVTHATYEAAMYRAEYSAAEDAAEAALGRHLAACRALRETVDAARACGIGTRRTSRLAADEAAVESTREAWYAASSRLADAIDAADAADTAEEALMAARLDEI